MAGLWLLWGRLRAAAPCYGGAREQIQNRTAQTGKDGYHPQPPARASLRPLQEARAVRLLRSSAVGGLAGQLADYGSVAPAQGGADYWFRRANGLTSKVRPGCLRNQEGDDYVHRITLAGSE